MKIVRVNFPSIVPDNEEYYISLISGYVESIDSKNVIQFTKRLDGGLNVRISPSHPKFLDVLIQKIKDIHNLFGIHVDFSKSMKASVNINYNINQ